MIYLLRYSHVTINQFHLYIKKSFLDLSKNALVLRLEVSTPTLSQKEPTVTEEGCSIN